MSDDPSKLQQRVVAAAEAVLEHKGSAGPLDLLQAMRWLEPCHVEQWRKGNPYFTSLEPSMQSTPEKRERVFRIFEAWAQARGLRPVQADYVRSGVRGPEPLRVTPDGDPAREAFFRVHYAPADLPERKARNLQEKLAKPPDLVVFILVSDESRCSECGAELFKGNFLIMEKNQPLCLACADMDHLMFLPSGDAALSRRSRKHSPLSAVVVRWSRARKRYERQGVLVTEEALARAEQECAADADERAVRREQSALLRQQEDRELVEAMTQAILQQFPGAPPPEARAIAAHTAERGSGRVGRSAAGQALEPRAIQLAVATHIRHEHTNYDALLMQGVERLDARQRVRETVDRMLEAWSRPGQVSTRTM